MQKIVTTSSILKTIFTSNDPKNKNQYHILPSHPLIAISPNTWRAGGQARKAPLPHQREGGEKSKTLEWDGG